MNYPKVVIIILNYNGWKDTIECLESVLRNDYPNYQVIVVDNGSQDNSMKYIKGMGRRKAGGFNFNLMKWERIYLTIPVFAEEARERYI